MSSRTGMDPVEKIEESSAGHRIVISGLSSTCPCHSLHRMRNPCSLWGIGGTITGTGKAKCSDINIPTQLYKAKGAEGK